LYRRLELSEAARPFCISTLLQYIEIENEKNTTPALFNRLYPTGVWADSVRCECRRRIDSLKNRLGKTTQSIERYKLLAAIGDGYYMTGIGENSADNNLEMLRIALRLRDDSLIAVSYNKAGDYFLIEKFEFNTAIDYFFKGIPYAEKAKDKRWICSIYLDLALAYYWAMNPLEQIKQLKKAEAHFPGIAHPYHDNLFNAAFKADLRQPLLRQERVGNAPMFYDLPIVAYHVPIKMCSDSLAVKAKQCGTEGLCSTAVRGMVPLNFFADSRYGPPLASIW
jgi:tetratricopeptide (TPR) repeat protein